MHHDCFIPSGGLPSPFLMVFRPGSGVPSCADGGLTRQKSACRNLQLHRRMLYPMPGQRVIRRNEEADITHVFRQYGYTCVFAMNLVG